MAEELINLIQKYGIINYTFVILFLGVIISYIYSLIISLINYIDNRAKFYFDKRKELKKKKD